MTSSTKIPIPLEGKDFERKCVPLFAGLLADPNAKMVGTNGQGQKGLDILARRDRDPHRPVGVQCKLRTRGDKLTETEIRSEVAAALAVRPPLVEYYIVTTAPDDTAYDLLAVQLSQEQADLGRIIDIQIWGWDTLQQRIHADSRALNAFDPGHSAASDEILQVTAQTAQTVTTIRDQSGDTAVLVQEMHAILTIGDTSRGGELEDHLDAEIDRYRDLINGGQARTALSLLESLKGRLTPQASPRIRARVAANLGWAKLQLDDDLAGARLLLDAYAINPDDPKTIANRIFGMMMTGDIAGALDFGQAALVKDPTNAGVAAMLFQVAVKSDEAFEPLDVVPAELLEDKNVRLHRVNHAHFKRPKAEWRRLARETYEALPDSDTAEQWAAEALLDEAFEARGFELHPIPPREPCPMLCEAVRLLGRQWDRVRGYENAGQPIYVGLAVNLANGLRAIGELARAQAVIEDAVLGAPNHGDARVTAASVALEMGKPETALDHLKAVEDLGSKAVLLLMAWERLASWSEIIAFATPERRADVAPAELITFDALLFRASVHNSVPNEIDRLGEQLLTKWPKSIGARVVVADAIRRYDSRRAGEMGREAAGLLSSETSYADRMMLAQLASELDDFEVVISALDGHVDVTKPSNRLLRLTLAFANAPVRPRTHVFFQSLSDEVVALPRFARLIGVGEAARGDLVTAERFLRVAVEGDASDARAHLVLESVLLRQDREDDARDFVLGVDEAALDGDPVDHMQWAYSLSRAGAVDRALALSYRTARDNRANQEVATAYPGLVYGADIPALTTAVETNSDGSLNIWFDLEGEDCPDVSGVIETECLGALDRYAPDHPLALAIKGKSVGDTISLPRQYGPDRHYKLRETKPKYVWLAHDIQSKHATRFPESTDLIEITVKDDDISPILEFIKDHSEQGGRIKHAYVDNAVPLAMVAAIAKINVIELADQFRAEGVGLRTCIGTHEERNDAIKAAFRASKQGAVIDLLTAWTLYRLEMLELAKAYFGRLLLPRSAVDMLIELRAKSAFHTRSEFMTLKYVDDQAYREMHTPEEAASNVETIRKGLNQILAHCEIMPTDGADDLLAHGAHFTRDNVAQVLDSMILARQHGMVLMSEDLHLRQWALGIGVPSATWLQPFIALATDAGLTTRTQYARAAAQLCYLRHSVVWLEPGSLIEILRLKDWPAEALFDAALTQLFHDGADLASHHRVAILFLAKVAGVDQGVNADRAARAIGKMLSRMTEGRDDWRLMLREVERLLFIAAQQSSSAEEAWRYLRSWVVGHFLNIDFDAPEPEVETGIATSRSPTKSEADTSET
ncbi:hypothetical protein [Phenylobacterium sp.]|uniref:PIN domain-containing protein n=1 Tax=Phenylobacterium sp. TaxID=1871053 RepID=UPI002731D543|nr:hypothetical protein [Phenylobacterium sp.]MDP1616675.1 hypothetical protein [Phenylobacterium sp.]MDP1989080.1 hypothetical protein [Phenylobacterium sp.]